MNVDAIRDGMVIDHITPGNGMKLYHLLGLEKLDAPVALMFRVNSRKLGCKDIMKIDSDIPLDLELISYVDPGATVNIIRNGCLVEKRQMSLPERLVNVTRCINPRCISATEQELDQVFCLKDADTREYRCLYCETRAVDV